MSDLGEKVFKWKDGVELHRIPKPRGIPVLLLHGGGARHETFMIPKRVLDGAPRSLADWLLARGFEPWLLDWRAGATAVENAKESAVRDSFDLDHAAKWDIPFALKTIRKERSDAQRIGAVGHCLGAGALAQAIASDLVEKRGPPRLTHVVLLTLGLFYETPLESRLKTQDRALERVWRAHPDVDRVDPRPPERWPEDVTTWPDELEDIYRNWPAALHPHPEEKRSRIHEACNRASIMYGTPYVERQLASEIHNDMWALSFESGVAAPLPGEVIEAQKPRARGTLEEITLSSGSWAGGNAAGVLWLIDGGGAFQPGQTLSVGEKVVASCTGAQREEAQLELQFGAIPLRMFVQAASNVRRRWAAGFGRPENDRSLVQERCRKHFDGLSVTLMTGARNQLWSPDSIHRMYEWLTRGTNRPGGAYRKLILRDYGHQDLLWGRSSRDDVFPKIGEGLGWKQGSAASPPPPDPPQATHTRIGA